MLLLFDGKGVPALQRNSVLSGGATPTTPIAIFDPTEVRLRTPFAPSHLRDPSETLAIRQESTPSSGMSIKQR